MKHHGQQTQPLARRHFIEPDASELAFNDALDPTTRATATTGLRFNTGKPRLHLLPWSQLRRLVVPERQTEALQVFLWAWRQEGATLPELPAERLTQVARVLEFGTRKYAPGNWTFGMAWLICVDCYFRHVCHAGTDAESELDSLAHADCNLVFLHEYIEKQVGTDDRPRLAPGGAVTRQVAP